MESVKVEFKPIVHPRPPAARQVSPESADQSGRLQAAEQRYRYVRVLQRDAHGAGRTVAMTPLQLDRPFGCPMCGCTFASQATLRKHVKRHSSCPNPPNPPCEDPCCRSHAAAPAATGPGQGPGPVSDARPRQDKPLLPHACAQCGRSFRTLGYLAVHQRVHTGVRPFTCACGKAFVRRCNLRAHLVSHTRERPHACLQPDCGQRFQFRKQLEQHVCAASGLASGLASGARPRGPSQQAPPAPQGQQSPVTRALASKDVARAGAASGAPPRGTPTPPFSVDFRVPGGTLPESSAAPSSSSSSSSPPSRPSDVAGGLAAPLAGRLALLVPQPAASAQAAAGVGGPRVLGVVRPVAYVGVRKALLLRVAPGPAPGPAPSSLRGAPARHPPTTAKAVLAAVGRAPAPLSGFRPPRRVEEVQPKVAPKLEEPEFIDIEAFAALQGVQAMQLG